MTTPARITRLSWDQFDIAVMVLASRLRAMINPHHAIPGIYGEPRGGMTLAVALSHRLRLPLLMEPWSGMIWVDDIIDSGETVDKVIVQSQPIACCAWIWDVRAMRRVEGRTHAPTCLMVDVKATREWYVFPWEDHAQAQRDSAEHYGRARRTIP
jgi:hypoxanthine phosphoribosyltransferase